MGSKIATILSLIFVVVLFLFGCDMMSLQFLYSDLDSKSITIGYLISQNSAIDTEFKQKVENQFSITFIYDGPEKPKNGDVVEFQISKKYKPIVISSEEMIINVKRAAVIGSYG